MSRNSTILNLGLLSLGIFFGILISFSFRMATNRQESVILTDELRRFYNAFSIVKNNYVDMIEDSVLINNAISGMLSNLDPHSSYLDEEAYKEIQMFSEGKFGGLGIEITLEENGLIKVASLIEGTPAEKAGILAGDIITNINRISTRDMPLSRAVKLMRGTPNSKIELIILHPDQQKPIHLKMTRDLIKIDSVNCKILENEIAYLRIIQFQDNTGEDLVKYITNLEMDSAPKGLILDLRNDPGGILNSAIAVSSVFLQPNSLVVSTYGRTSEARHDYFANPIEYSSDGSDYLANLPQWVKTIPMVILINSASASASEIVAGALQDYGRAKILGNRSFGKGSVQIILPLGELSGMKITTSRYFMPSGRSIQASGIEPDYVVADTEEGNLFSWQREEDLLFGDWRNISDRDRRQFKNTIISNRYINKMTEFGELNDFQLEKAINLLLN